MGWSPVILKHIFWQIRTGAQPSKVGNTVSRKIRYFRPSNRGGSKVSVFLSLPSSPAPFTCCPNCDMHIRQNGFPIEEFRLNDSRYDAIDNPDGLPNSVLFISDVQYEDNREITCIADNVEGSDETRAQLAVRDSDVWEK
ncbi:ig-like domain-containing protein [Trichonephila clavipes]|nr:ig-like domain-containing protein [Trichonephila clavipes]